MTPGATAAAVLLALRMLLPICDPGPYPNERAPDRVRCARCPDRTWVTVINEWEYLDWSPEVVDRCGLIHYHNTGKRGATYRCTACCREWTTEEFTGGRCWCDWDPSDGEVFKDACAALPESP